MTSTKKDELRHRVGAYVAPKTGERLRVRRGREGAHVFLLRAPAAPRKKGDEIVHVRDGSDMFLDMNGGEVRLPTDACWGAAEPVCDRSRRGCVDSFWTSTQYASNSKSKSKKQFVECIVVNDVTFVREGYVTRNLDMELMGVCGPCGCRFRGNESPGRTRWWLVASGAKPVCEDPAVNDRDVIVPKNAVFLGPPVGAPVRSWIEFCSEQIKKSTRGRVVSINNRDVW